MTGPILPIAAAPQAAEIVPARATRGGSGFQEALAAAMRTVEASGQNASAAVERFLTGEGEELHTTLLAVQRAELAFEMFLQARNKVVSAYQEIMRMQL